MMFFQVIRRYRQFIMVLVDVAVMVLSTIIALWIQSGIVHVGSNALGGSAMQLMVALVLLLMLFMKLIGLYPSIWRYTSLSDIVRLFGVVIGAHAIVTFFNNTIYGGYFQLNVFAISSMVMFLGLAGVRISYRLLTTWIHRRKGVRDVENVIIVGAGAAGEMLFRELQNNPKYPVKVVGFLDDNKMKKDWLIHGRRVLGNTYEVKDIVKRYDVTTAYIAMPSASKTQVANVAKRVMLANINVKRMGFNENDERPQLENIQIEDLLGRDQIKLDQSQIGHYIEDKVVLVTGAGGSIGSELCRQIIAYRPTKLIMLDIYENNLYDLQQELKHLPIEQHYLIASVRETHTLEKIFMAHKPHLVYHAAAHKHVPLMEDMPKEAIKNNIFGTYNVVHMSCKYNAERFTLISTDKAVNPTNVMGATKRMAELVCQSFAGGNTKIAAVRFGNVLGSNGSVIPLFKRQIQQGGPLTITHPDIIRYFMLIPEAVSLVLQAGGYGDQGEIFVLDMGEPVKIVDLAKNLINLAGLKEGEDIHITFTGLRPGEKMYEELILDKEEHRKTENELIYVANPVGLDKGQVNLRLKELDRVIKQPYNNGEVKEHLMQLIEV